MIALLLALIIYVVDPSLAIVFALIVPGVLSLDIDGNYSHLFVAVILTATFFFIRKVSMDG